jgi:hypothetical protein
MAEIPDEVLDRIERALGGCVAASLVLRNNKGLNEPYGADERWTLWTRWLEPASRKAYEAKHELQNAREAKR